MSRTWLRTLLLSLTMLGLCALWSSRLTNLIKADDVIYGCHWGDEDEFWTKQFRNLPTIWPDPALGQKMLDEYDFGFASAAHLPAQYARMRAQLGEQAWYALTVRKGPIHQTNTAPGAQKLLAQPFLDRIAKGKKLDPGNALYDLRLTGYYLSNAFGEIYNAQGPSTPGQVSVDYKPGEYLHRYVLKDQKMLALGAVSYLHAYQKELKSYRLDGVYCYLDLLPGPYIAEHYYQRFQLVYSVRPDDVDFINHITQKAAAASLLLAHTGHRDLAIRIADSIPQFYETTVKSMFTDRGDVPIGYIRRKTNICLQAAQVAGDKPLSQKLGLLTDGLTKMMVGWKKQRQTVDSEKMFSELHMGNVAANLRYFVTSLPPIPVQSYKASRMVENTLLDEITCSYILLGLAGLWLLSWLRELGWQRHLRKMVSTLPPLDWWYIMKLPLMIAGLGTLIWAMICQLSWVPWRADAPGTNWCLVSIIMYVVVSIGLPWLMARWRFKSWCQHNGVPVPGRSQEIGWNVGLLLTPVVLLLLNYGSMTLFTQEDARYPIIVFTLCCLVVLVIDQRSKMKNAVYFASANRLMQVFWAWCLIAISLSTMPFLLIREVAWLRQDTVGIGSWRDYETATAFARHEARLTHKELERMFTNAGWKLK